MRNVKKIDQNVFCSLNQKIRWSDLPLAPNRVNELCISDNLVIAPFADIPSLPPQPTHYVSLEEEGPQAAHAPKGGGLELASTFTVK